MLTTSTLNQLFLLKERVAIITGSTGVLGGAMAHGLAAAAPKWRSWVVVLIVPPK